MAGLSVLFLDRHHTSSRLAAAYFKKRAPQGCAVSSAGFEPQQLDGQWKALFKRLGIDEGDPRPRGLSEIKELHADLTIGIGLDAVATCPLPPGGLVRVNWDLGEPAANDEAHLTGHAARVEATVGHFFSDGYYDALLTRLVCFENIYDSLNEGILAHDLDRRIFYFSRGAEKILSIDKNRVIGMDCHELFSPTICGGKCAFNEQSTAADMQPSSYTAIITSATNERKELTVTRLPMRNENEQLVGTVLALSDVTRLHELEDQLAQSHSFSGIIGQEHGMRMVFELIRDIAMSDFPVVVTGESGTGKELVAAAIHGESNRRDRLFVPVNCAALPEGILESELFGHVKGAFTGAIRDKKGRFELADKGTLFLDEIAELSPRMQVKLLRVLQEGVFEPVGSEQARKVDVRIICATNRDLKTLVSRGAFRDDLYYRLAVMPIHVPPLRERRNDIPLLARHFLRHNAEKLSRHDMEISDETLSMLMNYSWPGNVRQLQNSIQFALIKCRGTQIKPEHLPPEITKTTSLPYFERRTPGKAGRKPKLTSDAVERAMIKAEYNKAKAARLLGVGRATLYNYLGEHREITAPEE
ncbi:MAG: sigma 54-interacting transcriptional regulator [Chitinispirillaceae bacterium]|nr:sigma 54-interacting transcriptional regulator [Chitinispirillaceae bacterium]